MITKTQIFLKQVVLLIDGAAIVGAFFATYFLRQNAYEIYARLTGIYAGAHALDAQFAALAALKAFDSYLWLLFIIVPLWLGLIQLSGGYRELRVKSFSRMAWILLQVGLLGLLFFGSVVFLLKISYVSRTFMLLFFILSTSFLCLERAFMIYCWRRMARRDYFQRNILIIGTGKRAQALIRAVYAHKDWGLRLVGLLDRDSHPMDHQVEDAPVLGTLEELPLVLKEYVIDEVIFVVPRNWMNLIEEGILYCERVGVRATVAADLFNLRLAKVESSEMNGIPLLSFETTPSNEWQMAIKRLFDLVISSAALVILAPLFVITALLIKLTSPGPVFFRQIRVGLNGRQFTLYKFRSMVLDAEARLAEIKHLNEMSGPVFKATNDPRMTPIGRRLRRTSIDELPQLWNVLKGEISLIGPRPPLPSEVAKYESWQRRRLSIRPGITGYWQVNGRSEIKDFQKWMELDLEYIDRWSLFFDMKIILKTIPVVLFGIGSK